VSAPTHPSSKQLDPVSCETQGHLWGDSACIMCKTPKPKYAPSLEFAMRQVERCRNYAPTDRVENEDTIVTLGDEIERLQEDLRLARIESAHFANTQRATQAELEMARVSSSELERYKRALYQANGQLMQLDKEPVKLDYSADEPSADAEKILEAYDACWIEDETGGHSRRTMDQLRDIGKRFNDARAAVLAAMRPAPPSTTRQDRRYVPGDYVHTEGKNAIALECPHVHVMYEDGTVERRPLHCTSRSTEEPRGVTIEMLTQARSKLSTAVPPREGYSQAYADQMRTALLRIAGWREIDRNSLGERLREIEEIALAALMPTVTKSAAVWTPEMLAEVNRSVEELGKKIVPGKMAECDHFPTVLVNGKCVYCSTSGEGTAL
jgi:hypothetical protein